MEDQVGEYDLVLFVFGPIIYLQVMMPSKFYYMNYTLIEDSILTHNTPEVVGCAPRWTFPSRVYSENLRANTTATALAIDSVQEEVI